MVLSCSPHSIGIALWGFLKRTIVRGHFWFLSIVKYILNLCGSVELVFRNKAQIETGVGGRGGRFGLGTKWSNSQILNTNLLINLELYTIDQGL